MTNELRQLAKDLKAFAKRCKEFKYTESALFAFPLLGLTSFAETSTTDKAIQNQRQEISTSIGDMRQQFRKIKTENDKLMKDYNLELIQLMEQGDHVVKSPWSSWQYGANTILNDWHGSYKGRGDKKEKYPYEGVLKRSSDPYERNVSTDSKNYSLLSKNTDPRSASSNNRQGMKGYGIASTKPVKEPIVGFEVNAGINPRNINKSPITIAAKTVTTPTLPPVINFTPPKPVISIPEVPNLPAPPTFNIQLGSYCNNMTGCGGNGVSGGPFNATYQGYAMSVSGGTPSGPLTDGQSSLRYSWAPGSYLLRSYFDSNSSYNLTDNLTVSSVNPLSAAERAAEVAAGRSYNAQDFLVGGSRVATLDNASDNSILTNGATINLVGPLAVGFEVQSDTLGDGTRGLTNTGTITDASESTSSDLNNILPIGSSKNLTGQNAITVKRDDNGFTGYKVGLIMTYENDDQRASSKYILTNNGTINFSGENSIGVQIYAPSSPSLVNVANTSNITMGGKESFGMKWSSRVSNASTMDNTGTITVSGDAGTDNSLSSGIAVVENAAYIGSNAAIRAYNGKVTNNGTIAVSGGKANTGMVLIVDAADDITNTSTGKITVSSTAGKQNMGMRVDKGAVSTDSAGTPVAINEGKIHLSGDSSIGMASNKQSKITNSATTSEITSDGANVQNAIGMVTDGGTVENDSKIELLGSGASTNTGVLLVNQNSGSNPSGTFGTNSNIKVTGDNSIGALVRNGSLAYAGTTLVQGNGVAGIVVGDDNTHTATVNGTNSGTITVNGGAATTPAGIYSYTSPSGATVRKGSYGLLVGKNSTFNNSNVGVDVNVKEKESIGIYAGDNAHITIGNHTVKASDGAVNYVASDGSTITLQGTGTSVETGNKSLLFYLGNSGTGVININGAMNANILGGSTPDTRGTAFYYVGSGLYTPFDSTAISNWATTNFGGTLSNLTLNMNPDSRLFIAQNVGMRLSDTVGSTVSGSTGAHINGTGYKTFMLYLSKLNINQDVNLDSSSDPYNELEISNSSIENDNTKTISGTQLNQVAMAQENDSSLYSRNKVTLTNKGTINLSGTGSTGMYAKYGEIYNDSLGTITMGDNSTAMYGTADSILSNLGTITLGSNSTGVYSEGSTTQGISNGGTIQTSGDNSVALSFNPAASVAGMAIENNGTITMTGDKNTAIYATGTPSYTARNTGNITLGNSAAITNPNVGIYTDHQGVVMENTGSITSGANTIAMYGYDANNSGNITVGDAAIGIYSQNGNVNLTGGTITTGTNEAVGVYTVGTGQTINNTGTGFNLGDNSFAFVNANTSGGNTIISSVPNVTLNNNNVFIYSNDTGGTVTNSTSLTSTGDGNYGIYSAGNVTNSGNMNFGSGVGNVGIYSIKGGNASNSGVITVGASNGVANKYSIGMAAGYGTTDTGHITNNGTINVNGDYSIGMYATGAGSTATNASNIVLNGNNTTGIYADNGATAINTGSISTGSGSYSNVVGVYLGQGSTLNNTGSITIDGSNAVGVYLKGGTIANYGNITVNGSSNPDDTVYTFTTPATGKGVGGALINAPAGATSATITINGVPQTPVTVNTFAKNPINVSASSIGLYVNTSGVDYTNSINGLGNLTSEADLIIGTEATEMTNSKSILVNDPKILNPYNNAMRSSGVSNWNIYSAGLNWLATPTLNPTDGTMTNIYMVKVPYTAWAGKENTPVNSTDTYNFLDGLEQRYGVDWYGDRGARERQLFSKLNSIGNNEEALFYQATDEMMGHQYGNVQQRINETGSLLDKEFKYLRNDWRNPSKQNNKIKVFGMRNEYNTDTAGIIDYTSNAYGVAYVHEDETLKLGNSSGWYAGAVNNRFKFKDIGGSRENQTMVKAGIFKTMSPYMDHNGSLRWTIAGDVFAGRNEMKRRFLVVDDIFGAKGSYTSYGAAFKTDLGYDIRMSERTHLRPYGALKMEYGRFNSIKEDDGEVRLEVKGNDYFSVKPEVGMEFKYVQPMAVRTQLSVGLTAAYENELGRVADGKNVARVRFTDADWFGIRGEKEDRRGSGKFDLNIGVDNTRFGVTANLGYDTKGSNIRGGIGFRAIY